MCNVNKMAAQLCLYFGIQNLGHEKVHTEGEKEEKKRK
jgi:hypothetical protein